MENKKKIIPANKQEEAVKLTPDDWSLSPVRFSEYHDPLNFGGGWIWCFGDDPNVPPIHFQRGFDGKAGLHGGDIQQGNGPLTKNTILENSNNTYPTGFPLPYKKVKGDPEGKTNDPVTYEMRGENPDVLYRISSKSAHFVENDYIDVTFDYFPYAFVMQENGFGDPYIIQLAEVKGTYGGKEMTFLGGLDRTFNGSGWEFILNKETFIVHMFFGGIRPDGVREYGYVYVSKEKRRGFYCKDGEEPVIANDVKFNPTWVTLPYADDNAQAIAKATFEYGGKTINYQPKWGWRGHGEKYINGGPCGIPGFSHTSGVWYEGSTPYEFERVFTYNEAYNAIPEKLLNS